MNASELSSINSANAAHSTGPRTVEGKERASMNALKHGLTGQRLILQSEEHDAYRRLSESLRRELRPRTEMESQLLQKIVDTHMRLNRVAALDNNLFNFGLLENLSEADDETAIAVAQAKAQTKAWIAQQNAFDKLGRYEARLSRQLIAYTKELERLQASRIEKTRIFRAERPSRTHPIAVANGQDLSPHNSIAEQSLWSSTSFRSKPVVADPSPIRPHAEEPKPAAA